MTEQQVAEIFKKIDDYWIGDVNTMLNCDKITPYGQLGYTCLQTIISGMDLIGGLLLSYRGKDAAGFNKFWDTYLVKVNRKYDNTHLRKLFRDAIRNGTAHYFMTKGGVAVHIDQGKNLEAVEFNDQIVLLINCKELFEEVNKAYVFLKQDCLADPTIISEGYKALVDDISKGTKSVDEYFESIGVSQSFHTPPDSSSNPPTSLDMIRFDTSVAGVSTTMPAIGDYDQSRFDTANL